MKWVISTSSEEKATRYLDSVADALRQAANATVELKQNGERCDLILTYPPEMDPEIAKMLGSGIASAAKDVLPDVEARFTPA